MFLSRNKKINVYPCKLLFYCIKVEVKGVKIIQACFRDGMYAKRRLGSAYNDAQAEQCLRCPPEDALDP